MWAGPQDEYGRADADTHRRRRAGGTRPGIPCGQGPRTSTPPPPPESSESRPEEYQGRPGIPLRAGPKASTGAPGEYPATPRKAPLPTHNATPQRHKGPQPHSLPCPAAPLPAYRWPRAVPIRPPARPHPPQTHATVTPPPPPPCYRVGACGRQGTRPSQQGPPDSLQTLIHNANSAVFMPVYLEGGTTGTAGRRESSRGEQQAAATLNPGLNTFKPQFKPHAVPLSLLVSFFSLDVRTHPPHPQQSTWSHSMLVARPWSAGHAPQPTRPTNPATKSKLKKLTKRERGTTCG